MRPHQEESGLGDVCQPSDYHLDYIRKAPTRVRIQKTTYFSPSGTVSDYSFYTFKAAKTISQGAIW